jgi:predicted small secreted protein
VEPLEAYEGGVVEQPVELVPVLLGVAAVVVVEQYLVQLCVQMNLKP